VTRITLPTGFYQQFDADGSRDVPAEGYGGWRSAELPLNLDATAVVVMHAWGTGTREAFPGWHRAVEYIPRADAILREELPRLLTAVRASRLRLYHIASQASYCAGLPGFRRAVRLTGRKPEPFPPPPVDPVAEELRRFRTASVFPGSHNIPDIDRGFASTGFPAGARPEGDEGVAADAEQLHALCRADGITHLVYAGFAINWCLLMSAGGMLDMSRRGFLCSAIRQAVTAVENKETARGQLCKELALWRVSVAFGFVYELDDFLNAIRTAADATGERGPHA
jgi:hypothetical protein